MLSVALSMVALAGMELTSNLRSASACPPARSEPGDQFGAVTPFEMVASSTLPKVPRWIVTHWDSRWPDVPMGPSGSSGWLHPPSSGNDSAKRPVKAEAPKDVRIMDSLVGNVSRRASRHAVIQCCSGTAVPFGARHI